MIASPPKYPIASLLASRRCQPLSRPAELVFLHRAQAGDRRAVDRLVLANMKFVAAVARRYQNQGLSAEDLIQEGAIGLQRAIEKFNPSSPNRLISYAVWWIRQRILMALAEQSRSYTVPQRFVDLAGKMEQSRKALQKKLGRLPDLQEIAKALKMPLPDLEVAIALLYPAESLDAPLGEEGDARVTFLIAPDETDAACQDAEQKKNLRLILQHLEPTDREILLRHYGLKTGEPETMAMIADDLNISRERVRQRQEKALGKLRRKAEHMELFTPTAKGKKPCTT